MWKRTREILRTTSTSLTIGSQRRDMAVQLAASETRLYASVRTTNSSNGIRLYEVDPQGGYAKNIGSFFSTSQSNWECRGLAWHATEGRLYALLWDGGRSRSWLYRISHSNGGATGPQLLTGEYRGLCFNGSVLVSTGMGTNSSTTRLVSFSTLDGSVSTLATIPSSTTGNVVPADVSGLGFYESRYYIMSRRSTTTLLTRTTGGTRGTETISNSGIAQRTGICFFGNNLYTGLRSSNSVSVGFQRNQGLVLVSSTGAVGSGSERMSLVKHANGTLYAMSNRAIYRVNKETGVFTFLATPSTPRDTASRRALIWDSDAHNLILFTGNNTWTIDPTSGTASNPGFTDSAMVGAYSLNATHWRTWTGSGVTRDVTKSSGTIGAGIATLRLPTGNWSSGFFNGSLYRTSERNASVYKDRTLLLTVSQPIGYFYTDDLAQINGTMYTLGLRTATPQQTRLFRYKGLFPEFYGRGTVIDTVSLGEQTNIDRTRGQTTSNYTLPLAHGGQSPYTYRLRFVTSTGTVTSSLPSGFSFSASTRRLTVASTVGSGDYIFSYQATDSETPAASTAQSFRVRVGAAPATGPQTGALALGNLSATRTHAQASSIQYPAATGGTSPYTYRAGMGQLVAGKPLNNFGSRTAHGSTWGGSNDRRLDVVSFTQIRSTRISASAQSDTSTVYRQVQYNSDNDRWELWGRNLSNAAGTRLLRALPDSGDPLISHAPGGDLWYCIRSSSNVILAKTPNGTSATASTSWGTRATMFSTPVIVVGFVMTSETTGYVMTVTSTEVSTGNAILRRLTYAIRSFTRSGSSVRLGTAVAATGLTNTTGKNYNSLQVKNGRFFVLGQTDENIMSSAIGTTLNFTEFAASPSFRTAGAQSEAGFFVGFDFYYTVPSRNRFTRRLEGRLYSRQGRASDNTPATRDSDTFTARGLPTGLTFDATTRTFDISSSLATGSYNIAVKATDSASPAAIAIGRLSLRVQDPAVLALPTITNISYRGGGAALSRRLPAATGGDGTTVRYVADIPNTNNGNITFNSATRTLGVASDTDAGTYSVSYEASDSTSTATRTFNVVVTQPTVLSLTRPTGRAVYNDQDLSVTLPAATGATSITYTLLRLSGGRTTSLPSGISFIAGSRRMTITGSSSVPGTYTLRYTARASDGTTVSRDFTVTVRSNNTPTQLVLPVISNKTATSGFASSFVLPEATGGDGTTITYTADIPNTARGHITFSGSSRRLSIASTTPPGTYDIDYEAEDNSYTATRSFNVVVSLSANRPIMNYSNQPVTLTLPETGSVTHQLPAPTGRNIQAPYTFSLASAITGVTLSSTGLITALSTTTPGTYTRTMTVQATPSFANFNAPSLNVTLTLVIAPAPVSDLALPRVSNLNVRTSDGASRTLPAATSSSSDPITYTVSAPTTLITFTASNRRLAVATTIPVGVYSVTYSATQGDDTVTQTFSVVVTAKYTIRIPAQSNITVYNDESRNVQLAAATINPSTTPTYTLFNYAGNQRTNLSTLNGVGFAASTRTVEIDGPTTDPGVFPVLLLVQAGQETATETFTITVRNELEPIDPILPNVSDSTFIAGDQAFSRVLPEAVGGTDIKTYSATFSSNPGGNISFDPSTRTLSATATTPAGTYTVTYTVREGAHTNSKQFRLIVVARLTLPNISDSTFSRGVADLTQTLPDGSGGTGAKTYRLSSDPASDFITFDTVSKVMTVSRDIPTGDYVISYSVTAGTQTATRTFRLTVSDVVLTLPTPQNITVRDKDPVRTVILPEASGGAEPYTYDVVGTLPTGVTWLASLRRLRVASSMAPGVYALSYTVRDADGATESHTFEIIRSAHTPDQPTPLTLGAIPDPLSIVQGQYYSLPLPQGGTRPYHFFLEQDGVGTLPTGVTFSAQTGRIDVSLTAKPEEYGLTYEGYDSSNRAQQVSDNFGFRVVARPTIQHTDYDIRLRGHDVAVQLPTASGGVGAHTYVLAGPGNAPLPEGLSLSGRTLQVFADTPSQSIDLVWRSTDTQHNTAEAIITLNIINVEAEEGKVIDPDTYPENQRIRFDLSETGGRAVRFVPANLPWEFNLPQATGGQGELTYHYAHPFSRSGRKLYSNGVAVGSYPITIRVRDENLAWFEIRYLIEVVEPKQTVDYEQEDKLRGDDLVAYGSQAYLVLAAYQKDGTPLDYKHYDSNSGAAFFYSNPQAREFTLSDELKEEITRWGLTYAGAHVLLYFAGESPLGNEESLFPRRNVPVPSIADELQRLDLQDEEVILTRGRTNQANFGEHLQDSTVPVQKLANEPNFGTQYILPVGINNSALGQGSVTRDKIDDEIHAHTVDSYSVYDIEVINEVEPGTEVGVILTEQGYMADPSLPTVGIMRDRNHVARTRGAVVQVNGVKRRVK